MYHTRADLERGAWTGCRGRECNALFCAAYIRVGVKTRCYRVATLTAASPQPADIRCGPCICAPAADFPIPRSCSRVRGLCLRASSRPAFPRQAPQPPSGELWLHEIKHDGFRVIACKLGKRVKLYSRPGNDLTYRFPLIVEFFSPGCARGHASSTGRRWRAARTAPRTLGASAIGTMTRACSSTPST